MIEINLIPDVKQELLKAQHTRAAVISSSILVSIIAGGIVVALALYVFGVQTVRSSLLDGQITDGSTKLSQVEDLSKILTIQNQLTKISELNASKNIDSRVFDMLSAVTPGGTNAVRFSQITIDSEASSIRLEGQTGTYDSMEVFKKTVASAVIEYMDGEEKQTVPLAADISTSDISYGENAEGKKVLRFVLTFTYPVELFSPATIEPVFKLSVDGNVTDSYLGIPKSLFEERAKDE
jgi:hypothetical protein